MRRMVIWAIGAMILVTGVQSVLAEEEELFDTKAAEAFIEKGIGHLKAKNLDAAVNALEEAVSIAPDAEAYYYLGYAYYLKGRTGDSESRVKSIESFEKAYELDPNFTPQKYKAENSLEKNSDPQDSVVPSPVPANPMLEAAHPGPGTIAQEQSPKP
ncbi:MAG: hypothetical protein A2010_02190 [Nitrospirae bacterium GWD2_57_9]|nr:MAG: hypothetical protein A2010_02190 [Nitrospirae bacterium GWD2_57_9]OGW45149.1 MAG: hypothetical protein A2078_11925 [Nitrospirae bacterium GWC2_57_9]